MRDQIDELSDLKGKDRDRDFWMTQIELASRHEKDWRERAGDVIDLYRDEEKRKDRRFNVLWANTEVLRPAIYSRTPKPDVRRRYAEGGTGRKGALLVERNLSFSMDIEDFDDHVKLAIKDYLLAGRGVVRVRYEPVIEEREEEVPVFEESVFDDASGETITTLVDEAGEPIDDGDEVLSDGQGNLAVRRVREKLVDEEAPIEFVPWDSFRVIPNAEKWSDVTAVAFRHVMTRKELVKQFGEAGRDVKLTVSPKTEAEDSDDDQAFADLFNRAEVWEVWDKEEREVLFLSEGKAELLMRKPDPLRLRGFFPIPRPLYSVETSGTLVPVPEYTLYQDQAIELNRVTDRIDKLVNALLVRGVYDASALGLQELLKSTENKLIPIENWQALVEKGGLDGVVSWMPVEQIAKVLQVLYPQRDALLSVIYQVTGLADILRGASNPRETARAQSIKERFGSLRLSPRQDEVARFVRDLLRIKAEIIVEHFDASRILQIGQVEGSDEQMVQALRDDTLRAYLIDIETDSTVELDAEGEKQQVVELIQAVASFFREIGPLVIQGVLPMAAAKTMLMWALRRWKISREVEEVLDQLGQGQAPPSPQDKKAEIDQAKLQLTADKQTTEKSRIQGQFVLQALELLIKADSEDQDRLLTVIEQVIAGGSGGAQEAA